MIFPPIPLLKRTNHNTLLQTQHSLRASAKTSPSADRVTLRFGNSAYPLESLFVLRACGQVERLNEFIDQHVKTGEVDINHQDSNGMTALIHTVRNLTRSALDNVEALLAAGADPNIQDNSGKTALSYAAERHDVESVKRLLAAGADPNIQDKLRHWNTLMYACAANDGDCIDLLIKAGADPKARANPNSPYSANALFCSINRFPTPIALIKLLEIDKELATSDVFAEACSQGDTGAIQALLSVKPGLFLESASEAFDRIESSNQKFPYQWHTQYSWQGSQKLINLILQLDASQIPDEKYKQLLCRAGAHLLRTEPPPEEKEKYNAQFTAIQNALGQGGLLAIIQSLDPGIKTALKDILK